MKPGEIAEKIVVGVAIALIAAVIDKQVLQGQSAANLNRASIDWNAEDAPERAAAQNAGSSTYWRTTAVSETFPNGNTWKCIRPN